MKEGASNGGPAREIDKPGKIMVSGVPKDNVYSDADLEKEFSVFGRMTEAYIVRDRRSKKSRGFAFVTYENPQDAADAIKAMEGKNLGSDRTIHCEQAVIGNRKASESQDDSSRGRGGGGGRGRGGRGEGRGRGFDRGGRGSDRGWRGGRGMDFGDFHGGRGMRGRGGDGMRGRGRGRGDFFEPDMERDSYYEQGPHPDMPPRGRPGRRTLLPNPGFRGGRGQGPPPGPPHGPRGPMMQGGADYCEDGQDGYWNAGPFDYGGEERGPPRERYDDGYQEGEYYDQPPHNDRGPPPARGGGRGGGPPPFRGRGMGHPHEGARMPREEADYSQREESYRSPHAPPRRGMAGGDYGGRGGAGTMRPPPDQRRESNNPEEYLPSARRRAAEDYGYPAEDGQDMRRQEAPRRPSTAQPYPEEEYGYDSHPRQSERYDNASRGRGAPGGGRGTPANGRGSAAQRRAPLLGHDPYGAEDNAQGGYYAGQAAADPYQDDGYTSYSRGGQAAAHRHPPTADDDRYGYDAMPAKAQAHEEAYQPKRVPAGQGMYDASYQEDSLEAKRRRDDYDSGRSAAGARRTDLEYSARTDDYPSDVYASYTQRSRAAMGSRDMEPDPYNRKRHMDFEEDQRMSEMTEARRDYQDFQDRSGGMMSGGGPTASKRDRYEGFYQARQEDVYREL